MDKFFRRVEDQRSIEAKIERLRQRAKNLPADVRAVILGVLDLLGDEL